MAPNKLSKIITKKDIQNIRTKIRLVSLALRLPCQCNFNCGYCYGKIRTNDSLLKFNEIKNILLQASELNARTVEIVGEGEPLLYPHFKELINYIDNLDMTITLYSNCSLITAKDANFLFKKNVTVIGKQNTLSSEKQNGICGVDESFQKIMKGLNNLIKTGFTETKPSRLGLHTVILKENIDEIPNMWREWRIKNIIPQVQALVYPSKKQTKEYFEYYNHNAVKPAKIRRLFEELSNIDKKEFGINWNPIIAYPIAPDGCRTVYGTLGVTQEGNAQICSFTEKPLGNLREKSIKEIISSEEVRRIRNIGRLLKYPDEGYGCRANALNMTGDYFAPDPFFDDFLSY
jgi:MoaA/NifB/PqqE/SkfB family radical SAM enzyme